MSEKVHLAYISGFTGGLTLFLFTLRSSLSKGLNANNCDEKNPGRSLDISSPDWGVVIWSQTYSSQIRDLSVQVDSLNINIDAALEFAYILYNDMVTDFDNTEIKEIR